MPPKLDLARPVVLASLSAVCAGIPVCIGGGLQLEGYAYPSGAWAQAPQGCTPPGASGVGGAGHTHLHNGEHQLKLWVGMGGYGKGLGFGCGPVLQCVEVNL
eukprot:964171-Pelagomonas_calceolata.AAC.4